MIGRPIIRFDEVASTQDIAFRLGERGAGEGTVVVAGHQTGGRGRAGRTWSTPPGEALLFSLLLRPDMAPERLSPLSVLIADAIATTVADRFGIEAAIKWPNDVLVDGRKLCGILIQVRGGLAVAGVGLNVLSLPDDLPAGSTSIRNETGNEPGMDELLRRLLSAVGDRYGSLRHGDTGPAIERVNARLHLRGEEAILRDGDRTIAGRIHGVRGDGALLLETVRGVRAVVSGELVRGPRAIATDVAAQAREARYNCHGATKRPVGPRESDT